MARFRYDRLADAKPGDLLELDRTEASHLFKILRARPGETAGLLDGKGNTGSATVTENRMLRLDSVETIPFPHRRIHLYLAPPRRQKMDQLLKEAAEPPDLLSRETMMPRKTRNRKIPAVPETAEIIASLIR